MKLDDFDFHLPEALIATRPARPRSAARLLVVQGDVLSDLQVTDLPALLRAGDRLVLNNTRVIPARLNGTRARLSA
ncbi:MAG: S-adenosylmethionine:tRNA ribosyltransferase-isomerase, partial [Paracoccaceae bacterium]|nr:S-adenosylmethionine:tRNA ribosyltransferase-isomerase [Paracoccaceae bacterium]